MSKGLTMRRVLGTVGGILGVGLAALLLLPSPIDAVAWVPAPAPEMSGVLSPNTALQKAELLARGKIEGPEDLAFDQQGRIYAGLQDGRIVRVSGAGTSAEKVETFVKHTGGRPLGMQFDAHGNLVVCDAWKGLLSISPEGKITTLAVAADGVPFAFADDLDIAADGKIYFTDASSKWQQPDYLLDFLEGRPYGRLLVYDPATGKVTTLLKDLYFANGVALSAHEDFVAVAETYRYRIKRYWLKGEKAGTADILAENLPGLPDNLNSDRQGRIWVALPSPRKADADFLAGKKWLRELLAKLPRSMWPKATRYGMAVAIDESGRVVESLHDPEGDHLRLITTVQPRGDELYFGSLENDRIGRLKHASAEQAPATH